MSNSALRRKLAKYRSALRGCSFIYVDVLNVGARLRCPEKLNGHEEWQTLFPGVLHPAPHQNPLRQQDPWLCLLPTQFGDILTLLHPFGRPVTHGFANNFASARISPTVYGITQQLGVSSKR
jgi:hypothetical protein